MNTTTRPPEACPATGRSASVCADQTHVACYAAQRLADESERRYEQHMAELIERQLDD